MSDRAGWLASFAGGTLLWSVATLHSGGREPWDTGEYWAIYLPLACMLSGLLGFALPDRTWRWALAVMLAQMPVMWVAHGVGSLWIPGLVMLLILALPVMLIAALGGIHPQIKECGLTAIEIAVEVLGWAGASLILLAYLLLSAGKLTGQSTVYQGMNVAGAAGFIVNGWWHGAMPSAVLNVIWMLIGAIALWRIVVRRRATGNPTD